MLSGFTNEVSLTLIFPCLKENFLFLLTGAASILLGTGSSCGRIVECLGVSVTVMSSPMVGGGGGFITLVHKGSHLQTVVVRWQNVLHSASCHAKSHVKCYFKCYLPFPPEYRPLPEYKRGIFGGFKAQSKSVSSVILFSLTLMILSCRLSMMLWKENPQSYFRICYLSKVPKQLTPELSCFQFSCPVPVTVLLHRRQEWEAAT